jgi:hypothetical protein
MDPALILIDGYNVIRRTPSLAAAERRSLHTAREALLAQVVSRYRGTPHRVIVVFDGQAATESVLPLRCGVGSQQRFSPAGTTADAVIRRLVEGARDEWGSQIVVFSDDWEVGQHAISSGTTARSVGELTQRLNQAPRHLHHRVQHHAYLRQRADDDAQNAPRQPRKGNAHKSPRQRRGG